MECENMLKIIFEAREEDLAKLDEDDEIFIPQRVEIKPINKTKHKKKCC